MVMQFFTSVLRLKLRVLARLTVWRYEPRIVGVTGSVGKTSTKVAIGTVLRKEHRVRVGYGNLNNELGLALTILGDWDEKDLKLVSRAQPTHTMRFQKFMFFTKVICISVWRVIKKSSLYPEVLILEYGADRPYDIKYLLKIARPNIGVITAIGEMPSHVEFYNGPQDVAREKGRLIDVLLANGFAVLNADDEAVLRLKNRTRARVMTYGFSQGADIRIVRFENHVEELSAFLESPTGEYTPSRPVGISFKLEQGGSFVPVRIDGVFGRAHALAGGAAAAVGLIFGMNLVKISEALEGYISPDSRMQLSAGIKRTIVIDDAYNASPLSTRAALETLREFRAKRKIAVLGDMLEIGKYTIEAHEQIGRLAGEIVDMLVAVGPRAKFIAESAKEMGMKKGSIYSFETTDQAIAPIKEMMHQGDIVLVKGSHAMELDKVVREITVEV